MDFAAASSNAQAVGQTARDFVAVNIAATLFVVFDSCFVMLTDFAVIEFFSLNVNCFGRF